MANDDEPSGFLSRWSRRKADVRQGRPLDEPPEPIRVAEAAGAPTLTPNAEPEAHAPAVANAKPAPTLVDAQKLTPESDFTGFMARGVAPDVKNAAMKKLFTDPHFNVMDRMDIYIDDYTQPDPLPLAMLRQMASAKTLNLFDDEDMSATSDSTAPSQSAAPHSPEPEAQAPEFVAPPPDLNNPKD